AGKMAQVQGPRRPVAGQRNLFSVRFHHTRQCTKIYFLRPVSASASIGSSFWAMNAASSACPGSEKCQMSENVVNGSSEKAFEQSMKKALRGMQRARRPWRKSV